MFYFSIIFISLALKLTQAQNACTNSHDVFHWRRLGGFFDFREIMRTCSLQHLADTDSADFDSDFAGCLQREGLPYRFTCRVCFAELAKCTIDICLNGCFFGDSNPICEECADTSCNPNFIACGGDKMNPKECPECVKPLGKILFLLPDWATIVIIILLFFLMLAVVYRCSTRRREEETYELPDDLDLFKEKGGEKKPFEQGTNPRNSAGASYYSDSKTNNSPHASASKSSKDKSKSNNGNKEGSFSNFSRPKDMDQATVVTSKGLGKQLQDLDFDQMTEVPQFFRSNKNVSDNVSALRRTNFDFDEIEGRTTTNSPQPPPLVTAPMSPPPGFLPVVDHEENEEEDPLPTSSDSSRKKRSLPTTL